MRSGLCLHAFSSLHLGFVWTNIGFIKVAETSLATCHKKSPKKKKERRDRLTMCYFNKLDNESLYKNKKKKIFYRCVFLLMD
jgi:hypothetical protein